MDKKWCITEKRYRPEKELLMETLFTLSNGYMASRGTLEEGSVCTQLRQYQGTYAAGIFDKYSKDYQAIVNLPDFFNTPLFVNGEALNMMEGEVRGYVRYLDMRSGILRRELIWTSRKGEATHFCITRFISKADPHLALLQFQIKPLNYSGMIRFHNILDGNVSNIDFHVSGYQLRDEKYHFINEEHEKGEWEKGGYLLVRTRTTGYAVCEGFRVSARENGQPLVLKPEYEFSRLRIRALTDLPVVQGRKYTFVKLISLYTSRDRTGSNLKETVQDRLREAEKEGYEVLFERHSREWNRIWQTSDIRIKGPVKDQLSVRFNLYHIVQMGNRNDPRVNIGSRGLTSEMHYGNCFWDTELFIMPFFIFTDPAVARSLVKYRYLTLGEARNKARALWFRGAMFPWMSSFPGKEQADYWEYANIAVHVVSDVAFGIMNYYRNTGDADFMLDCGLEVMIETARFWASRVDYNPRLGRYIINTVKGPNEYDGVVNNNTYTNWNAQWNLEEAFRLVLWAAKEHPVRFKKLAKKIGFTRKETSVWKKIIRKMYINYDRKKALFIEDDIILDKRPVDIKKMKPGKKITTELGLTWDTILRHKVVKQADVLLMIYLHRDCFTREQLRAAWKFYEPITLHDSSLSYNTHAILAAELGLKKKSYEYFIKTSRLDIDDVMENTFLGIHAANAGGTWQCVVNGFCGMRIRENKVRFTPCLPDLWQEVEFHIIYKKNIFRVLVGKTLVRIELKEKTNKDYQVRIEKNMIIYQKIREKE
ncbi:MAG: glycosyl hydrolase family 65 protein [bacterium]|nr:glycosyl hydrolase family 65 protein [bacterium]